MKRIILAAMALFGLTGTANAWEFKMSGADVSASYQYWFFAPGQHTATVTGRAQFDFGNNLFGIAGGTAWNYDFTPGDTQFEAEAHLGYNLDHIASVGAFVTYEYWTLGGLEYLTPGIEIAGMSGPVDYDAFVSAEFTLGTGFTNLYAGADAMYDVNSNLSLGLRTTLYGWAGSWDLYPALVARYQFDSGCYVEANYTADIYTGGIDHSIGFKIGRIFGQKPTFGSRDWSTRAGGW